MDQCDGVRSVVSIGVGRFRDEIGGEVGGSGDAGKGIDVGCVGDGGAIGVVGED